MANDKRGQFLNFIIQAAVGALIGGAVGGGIEIGRQLITEGRVSDWGRVGATAVGGALSGAIAGVTMGASLGVQATAAVGGAVLGGAVTRAISGQKQTAGAIITDAIVGGLTFGIIRGGSAAISSLRQSAAQQAERQLLQQTGQQISNQALSEGARQTERQIAGQAAQQLERQAVSQGGQQMEGQAARQGIQQAEQHAFPPPTQQAARQVSQQAAQQTEQQATEQGAQQATKQATQQVGQQGEQQGGQQMYRIGEGVRRTVANRELGQSVVRARIVNPNGALGEETKVPLSQLLSPKSSIPRDDRFLGIFKAVGSDLQSGTGSVPPIEIIPVPEGAGSGGLTPVPSVTLLKWRGPF